MQRSIPCLFMRGGTSRGPFFMESDLPTDIGARDPKEGLVLLYVRVWWTATSPGREPGVPRWTVGGWQLR